MNAMSRRCSRTSRSQRSRDSSGERPSKKASGKRRTVSPTSSPSGTPDEVQELTVPALGDPGITEDGLLLEAQAECRQVQEATRCAEVVVLRVRAVTTATSA